MNLLEKIKQILSFANWKESSSLPGWRHPGYRSKKSRIPFMSSRKREPGEFRMHIEEFPDRESRNQRYQELKQQGVRHLSKMTTQRDQHIVWQLLKP